MISLLQLLLLLFDLVGYGFIASVAAASLVAPLCWL